MEKTIEIIVTPSGEVKIETRGFKGEACIKESSFIKDVLGEETSKQLTPAYWEKEGCVKRHLPLCG